MKLNIKCSNDTKLAIDAEPTDTIATLKQKIADSLAELPASNTLANTAADSQRLIFAGRVLKDDDQVATYKMAEGHTVHLVKVNKSVVAEVKREASDVSPVVPGAPANTPVTPSTANPLAALGGLRTLSLAVVLVDLERLVDLVREWVEEWVEEWVREWLEQHPKLCSTTPHSSPKCHQSCPNPA